MPNISPKLKRTKNYHIYILECANGSLYTGIAIDVAARFKKHCAGKGAKYTRMYPPVRILAQCKITGGMGTALKLERKIKRLSRTTKLKLTVKPLALRLWVKHELG